MAKKQKGATGERNYIAIDLGTVNTLVYVSGQDEIIYNQPSAIAYDAETHKVLAYGDDAYEMLGRSSSNVDLVLPLRDGVISDLNATKDYLTYIFEQLQLSNAWDGAAILLACPSEVTKLERQALTRIAQEMGALHCVIEEEALMAALGSGIDIYSPKGNLIIDIGGGTSDIAVIASERVVVSHSARVAGNAFNNEIAKYVREKYSVFVGDRTAEDIKIKIGSAVKTNKETTMKAVGRDVVTGLPRRFDITSEEVRNILLKQLEKITYVVIQVLEETPPELSADILNNGGILAGGGALLKGADVYFSEIFQIPISIAPDPLLGVINGAKAYEDRVYEIIDENMERILADIKRRR